jgi:hypothetical protein
MTSFRRIGLFVLVSTLAATVITFVPEAVSAQCALCKTAVEQAGGAAARAMNLGILVLLVPPVAIFCAIFAVAYRGEKRDENGS